MLSTKETTTPSYLKQKQYNPNIITAMKTTELKQGYKIYDIVGSSIKWYKYLCVHPTGQGKYHILIDNCEEPIRIYGEKLQAILDKNLTTYGDAKLALVLQLEGLAKNLRGEYDFEKATNCEFLKS
jgi:hypothetical protein